MLATRTPAIVALLIVLIAGMAVVRLHTYDEPLEMDAAIYAVIAREMRAGRHLYSELWDHKPPAVHATFAAAQMLAGSGPAHTFLLGLLAASITLLGVDAAATAVAGRTAGLFAAAFWAIVSADLGLEANQPNTEVFINAALIWGFALLVSMPTTRVAAGRALGVGALFALASLYKHVAGVTAGALLVAHVALAPPVAAARRRAAVQALLGGAMVAGAWGALLLYFFASGRLGDFWSAVIGFNQVYAGSPWTNLFQGLFFERLLAPPLYPVLPLVALAALGALSGAGGRGRAGVMLGAYALGTAIAVALPGRFFAHYYQLWLPLLAVAGAWGLARLCPPGTAADAWRLRAGSAVIALLLAVELPSLGVPAAEWSRRKFGERLVRNQALGRAIDAILLPGETFFQWGNTAEIYYYSGRRPPTAEFGAGNVLIDGEGPGRVKRLLDDLERERPELLLVSTWHEFPLGHPVPEWLLAHYAELDPARAARAGLATRDFRVMVWRGGALEQRVRGRTEVATAGAG